MSANDNRETFTVSGSHADGCVIRNARGRIVYGPTTLSFAARKLTELNAEPVAAVRSMLVASMGEAS